MPESQSYNLATMSWYTEDITSHDGVITSEKVMEKIPIPENKYYYWFRLCGTAPSKDVNRLQVQRCPLVTGQTKSSDLFFFL